MNIKDFCDNLAQCETSAIFTTAYRKLSIEVKNQGKKIGWIRSSFASDNQFTVIGVEVVVDVDGCEILRDAAWNANIPIEETTTKILKAIRDLPY